MGGEVEDRPNGCRHPHAVNLSDVAIAERGAGPHAAYGIGGRRAAPAPHDFDWVEPEARKPPERGSRMPAEGHIAPDVQEGGHRRGE